MTEATERESMEFDVVIVGAGPAGLAAAIRLKQLASEKGKRRLRRRAREGLGGRRSYPVGRRDRSRGARPPPPRLAQHGLAATDESQRRSLLLSVEDRRHPRAEPLHAAAHEQSRLLYRQPWQSHPLARRAGRSSWRRDLSRLRRHRCDLRRQWRDRRRHHRRHGRGPRRQPQGQLCAAASRFAASTRSSPRARAARCRRC